MLWLKKIFKDFFSCSGLCLIKAYFLAILSLIMLIKKGVYEKQKQNDFFFIIKFHDFRDIIKIN